MKKLMMTVAVAFAAIGLNAASTSWTWTTGTSVLKNGYKGSDVMSGTTVYCIYAQGATAATDKSQQAALLADLRDGTYSISDLATLATASAKTDANGQIATAQSYELTDVDVGSKAYFYEVVVSDDGKYVFLSGLAGATAQNPPGSAAIKTSSLLSTTLKDSTGEAAYNGGGWYAINVPEPTSGLLLLLGVAGLALRRRRA